MTNIVSAVDVAAWILPKKDEEHIPSMTLRKLQKLVYYCQAWSLVWDDTPLFKEDIVACRCCGPMIPKLQEYALNCFGRSIPIKKGVYEIFNTGMDLCFNSIAADNINLPTKTQERTIMRVLEEYREDAIFLESFSKEEGPFKKALRGVKGKALPIISIEDMKRYYIAVDQVRSGNFGERRHLGKFLLDIPAWG